MQHILNGQGVKQMKIFVVNAGSSTLKYQVIDMSDESLVCKGICERIAATDGTLGTITHKTPDGKKYEAELPMPTHAEAFESVVYALQKVMQRLWILLMKLPPSVTV